MGKYSAKLKEFEQEEKRSQKEAEEKKRLERENMPMLSAIAGAGYGGVPPVSMPATQETAQTIGDMLAISGSGTTFGLAPKLLSQVGVTAPQKRVEEARERLGGIGTLLEVTSGFVPGIKGGNVALNYLGPKIGQRKAGMATGFGEGLLGYYGMTKPGEETLGGAATSALLPPAIGLVAEPAFRFAEYITRKPREEALRRIGGYMGARRGSQATTTTAEEIAETAADKTPFTIAERFGGPDAEGFEPLVTEAQRAVTPEDRVARDILVERTKERAAGRPSRIFESADAPTPETVSDMIENISDMSADASKFYDSAYFKPIKVSENLSEFLNRPAFQENMQDAINTMANRGRLPDIVPQGTTKARKLNVSDLAGTEKIKETLESLDNPTEIIDLMIQNLDDKISKLNNKGAYGKARDLTNVKYQVLNQIEEINPDFTKARKLFAGSKARENAMDEGRRIASIKEVDFQKLMEGMSPDERSYFVVGAMDFIKDELAKPKFGKLKFLAEGDFENLITRRLRKGFPDSESFSKFVNTLSDELKMLDLEKVGKITFEKAEGIIDKGLSSLYVRQSATGAGRPGAFINISTAIRRFSSGKMSPREAEEVVDILTRYKPEEVSEVLDDLVRAGDIDNILASEIQKRVLGVTVPTAITTGATAPRDEE